MTTHTVRPAPDEVGPPASPQRTLPRRSVLKALGIGGATVMVAGTGAISYRTFDNGVLDSGSGAAYEPWSQWRTDRSPLGAVGAAILAANPHNTQPWLFHVTGDRIEVFADAARVMPAVDPFQREHDVGLGCALENLALGLRFRGFAPTVTLLPEAADPTNVASVSFTHAVATTSPLHDAHRRPAFQPRPLPQRRDRTGTAGQPDRTGR